MNNIASLYDYVLLNNDNPIGYTYDLYTCVAALIYRENSIILAHLEMSQKNNSVDYKSLFHILDLNDDNILNIELFAGPKTDMNDLKLIGSLLDNYAITYEIKESFVNIYGKGSIGFDYNTRDYYFVDENYELKEANILKKIL